MHHIISSTGLVWADPDQNRLYFYCYEYSVYKFVKSFFKDNSVVMTDLNAFFTSLVGDTYMHIVSKTKNLNN